MASCPLCPYTSLLRERSESIEWFIEDLAFTPSYNSAPLTTSSSVSTLSLFLCLPVRRRSTVCWRERGGWAGEEPNRSTARKHCFMQQDFGQIFPDDSRLLYFQTPPPPRPSILLPQFLFLDTHLEPDNVKVPKCKIFDLLDSRYFCIPYC